MKSVNLQNELRKSEVSMHGSNPDKQRWLMTMVDEREERYRKERSRSRRHLEEEEFEGLSGDSEEEYGRRHERERDRGGDRERDRDSHRRRDYDDDYTTEEESSRRAPEDGKRKKRGDRVDDEPYMSGGLGR